MDNFDSDSDDDEFEKVNDDKKRAAKKPQPNTQAISNKFPASDPSKVKVVEQQDWKK